MMRCLWLLCLSTAAALSQAAPQAGAVTGQVLPQGVLQTMAGVSVRHGGFGSAAFADPAHARRFYALTDRGPNADGAEKNQKIFPVPGFSPVIGHFERLADGRIRRVRSVVLKRPDGTPLSGLPNPPGLGATGEIALDMAGRRLPEDAYGLDSEGLVVTREGEFWVSDEYGPHLVHFNRHGVEQERISPHGLANRGRTLPAVLAKRRPNRGMEGLALAADGHTLVGIMQSTLYNPSKEQAINRTLTRIVTFDTRTGRSRQYLYRQNADNLSNSEIVAVDAERYLVVERDGGFAGNGKAVQKHVYLIDLRDASEVGGDAHSPHGLLLDGKALEQHSWEALANAGIRPVRKTLVLDLVAANGYAHDKLEGLFLIGRKHLAALNDDDFAIESKQGRVAQKVLPASGQVDANTLYVYPLRLPER